MAILHPHPAGQLVAQDLAEVIDTVAAQVRNGTKTEQEAYAAYDAQRTELAKLNRTIHNSQMARGMTESLERSFEIDRINRCIANPRYGC
ncbi:hypothetical protein C7G41_30335 [Bradyrhizobium sp. MOS002]|nr:hypothetical protein C7G41_30335 [Bradyrhizobium sp. MOS002]